MVVVVVVLATLALLVIPNLGAVIDDAPEASTRGSMSTLRAASLGFYKDSGRVPRTVGELFIRPAVSLGEDFPLVALFNPATGRGWNGPYVATSTGSYAVDLPNNFTATYGIDGDGNVILDDPACLDGWGSPIVLQIPNILPVDTGGTVFWLADEDDKKHIRLVSAGFDGVLDTPLYDDPETTWNEGHYPTKSACGDDLVLYLRVADLRPTGELP